MSERWSPGRLALARQSGGTVRIQRGTSAGTEVEIYVPRALGATNPEPPQAEEDMLEATGPATVSSAGASSSLRACAFAKAED